MLTSTPQHRSEPGILSRVPAFFRVSIVFRDPSRDGSATVTILLTTPSLWRRHESQLPGHWAKVDVAALVLAVKVDLV